MSRISTSARPSTRSGGPLSSLLGLIGPTASGKTEASVVLAERLGAEIVVVDSMTVYRGMDVGTAKPSADERARVRHHLVDVGDPGAPVSVAWFQALARETLADMASRGCRALVVGGSGLYFRAVVDGLEFPGTDPGIRTLLETEGAVLGADALHDRLAGLDPVGAGKIEPANLRRTVRALEVAALTGRPFSSHSAAWERYPSERVRVAGVHLPSPVLHARIESRVRGMFEGRLLEEARALKARGFVRFLTSAQAIGYLEAVELLEGRLTAEEAVRRTVRRTKDLARRQLAWFRRDPRVRWFEAGEGGAVEVLDALEGYLRP